MGRIITLITDFGTTDGYMGAVYGVIKSINPDSEVINIASNIPAADIRKAARALLNSYRFFPEGTIHMVVVDPTVGPNRRALLLTDGSYYFVGPDNGLFTPVMKVTGDLECYQITNDKFRLATGSETFHGRDMFAPAAAYISMGVAPEEFGPKIDNPVTIDDPDPEKFGDELVGKVIDIDAFGNLVTNIPSHMVKNDSCIIFCNHKITGLSKSYADVDEKQPLAYIGSFGNLEIGINKGNAANFFGALVFDEVKITDFK
ncbi:MAG: SAM-dependent chlorinase/fluorinase [candidate division Zixibacteria bacterium]|nr:SAM-dependent chlorinase/fluorinase [candidate division Zixibacteria bacterium]